MLRITRKNGQSLVLMDKDGNPVCEIVTNLRNGQIAVGIASNRSTISVSRGELVDEQVLAQFRAETNKK